MHIPLVFDGATFEQQEPTNNMTDAPCTVPVTPSSSVRKSQRKQGRAPDVSFGNSTIPALKKLSSIIRNDSGYANLAGGSCKKQRIDDVDAPLAPVKKKPKVGARVVVAPVTVGRRVSEDKVGFRIPLPARGITELEPLSRLIKEKATCNSCKKPGSLSLTYKTICLATNPVLTCGRCPEANVATPSMTLASQTEEAIKHGQPLMVGYETNMRYVIGFVLSGDGGSEAQKLLSVMGLPNSTSMKKSSFSILEESMYSAVAGITKESLHQSLIDEVLATEQADDFDIHLWKECLESNHEPADNCKPFISVSMDMGWQKRSSGRRYDSNSGHAFLIGKSTRKAVAMCLKSKYCKKCSAAARKNTPAKKHCCQKNHFGSSGSMESSSLLEMTESLYYNKYCCLSFVITDDDSSMKANCKWSNEDWAKHMGLPVPTKDDRTSGLLRYPIPPPDFLADPAHRKKTLRNHLWKLMGRGKKGGNAGLVEGDILRLTMYFIYMVRQLHDLPESEWVNAAKAVLEHHFDNHEFCGDFCQRKNQTPEEREVCTKVYRSMEEHKVLYEELKKVMEPFISIEGLREVSHGGDTQANESMNNAVSWLAPKNKTYCGSISLLNRVSVALCVNLLGYDVFMEKLFSTLGLVMNPSTWYSIKIQQQHRLDRLLYSKTSKCKIERNARVYKKLKEYFDRLNRDHAKKMKYQAGLAMRKEKANRVGCKHCGGTDHKMVTSKKCANYVPRKGSEIAIVKVAIENTEAISLNETFAPSDRFATSEAIALDNLSVSSNSTKEPHQVHTDIYGDEESISDESSVEEFSEVSTSMEECSLLDGIGLSYGSRSLTTLAKDLDAIDEDA